MDWPNERYVRVYTRDTGDWCMWSWQTRALLVFLFRKVDRSGLLHLGKGKLRALAFIVGMPEDEVATALEPLLEDGCVQLRDDKLVIPNFMKAQETPISDKLRKQESRERAREDALGHEPSRAVTSRHEPSQSVTPICADPSLAKPFDSAHAPDAGAGEKKVRKGTRLPEGWTPSAGSYANVVKKTGQNQAEVLATLDEFCDFWRGVPGQKGCKLDWDATFRNRLREVWSKSRSKGFRSGRFPSSPPAGPAAKDFEFAPGELEHARTKRMVPRDLPPAIAAFTKGFGHGPSQPQTEAERDAKRLADKQRLREMDEAAERKAGAG